VRGRLFPVEGDWYEWRQEPPLSATVRVRVSAAGGGRLVLSGLEIDGPPTAELLRAIPVGRLEATANAQLAADLPDGDSADGAGGAGGAGAGGGGAGGRAPAHRRPAVRAAPADGTALGWETTDPAGAVSRAEPHPAATRGRPDGFYREIAMAYLDYAQASHRPAVEIAQHHRVPLTTAHRWVKEARRRGFLPPGRPGRVG